jgi:hypothetical protein
MLQTSQEGIRDEKRFNGITIVMEPLNKQESNLSSFHLYRAEDRGKANSI